MALGAPLTLLRHDEPLDLNRRPAAHAQWRAAAVFERLHAPLRVPPKPFVACFARYAKLQTQLRHRKMTAARQTYESLFLIHR